jgi:GAF domain-containing protein
LRPCAVAARLERGASGADNLRTGERDTMNPRLESLRDQLDTRRRQLEVLKDLGAALSSTPDLDSLAAHIYEQSGRIMNTNNFFLALHDPARNLISFPLRVESRERLPHMAPRPYANGLIEHLLRTRRPLLMNGDVLAQANTLGLAPMGRQSSSWIGAPLLAEGEAIGVIVMQDHDGSGGYDEHDLDLLTLIAGQAAAALRNAQLLAQAHDAYRELTESQSSRLEAERLRSITETVGTLNHEINNPLTAIAGNAQLLLREPNLPPEVEDKVQRILDAVERIQMVTAKMANLIEATSVIYPGNQTILDVRRSQSRES